MQTPWALLALATLVLPWTLVRRRRPTTPPPRVVFPAISLLAAAQKRSIRRKERRNFILATIRSIAILALALTWAAPFSLLWSRPSSNAPSVATDGISKLNATNQRVADGRLDGRPIRLLVVDGADSSSADSSESPAAFYVAAALNPNFDATQPTENHDFPNVEIVSSSEFALTPANALDLFDAICWVDVSAPTVAELDKIERFLAADAASPRALIVFAGPRTNVLRWNAAWRRWRLDVGTLDVAFNPATGALAAPLANETREALQTVVKDDVKERLFAESFVDFERSGVDSLPIWRAFPLVGRDAIPILRDTPSNVPTAARLAAPSRGVVLWFASAPDAATSSLAFAPSFVPLLDRLVEFALQESLAETASTNCSLPTTSISIASNRFSTNLTAVPSVPTSQEKEKTRQATARTLWFATIVLLAFECWFSAPTRFFRRFDSSANRCKIGV
ncbi:MAG: hypothetical protein IKU86_04580 [Thermoguttaceae bacterium]|nr:hypothetical protein [Thermoguttaceae bacterium]